MEQKPDVTLSDGTAITFDKKNVKHTEVRDLFKADQPDDVAHEILGRFTSTSTSYIEALSQYDWQLLLRVMWEVLRRPVDPNSDSGSTGQ